MLGFQSTDPLSHLDLHLAPGRRAVWWGSCERGISSFGIENGEEKERGGVEREE